MLKKGREIAGKHAKWEEALGNSKCNTGKFLKFYRKMWKKFIIKR